MAGRVSYASCYPVQLCVHTFDIRWPDAGFFRALDARFGPQLRRYYKAAKNARDLHLGDAHLIPLEETPKTGSTHQQTWVALLVAKHNVKPQNVIQPMSSVVHIDALKEAVLKLKVVGDCFLLKLSVCCK